MTDDGRTHPYLGRKLQAQLEDACADMEKIRRWHALLPSVGLERIEQSRSYTEGKSLGSVAHRMAITEWLERYALPLKIRVNELEAERERGQE